MSPFEFATASRIIFGAGKFAEAGEVATSFGKRILVVTGGASCDEPFERLHADLAGRGASAVRFIVTSEPSIATIDGGLALARDHGADCVVGLGGGSAMDTAKCLAGLITNGGELLDYLEVVGKGQLLTKPAAPCMCIPTTAGTGAEVTRNSVVSVPAQQVKASIRSPFLLPRVALVDPELTYSLPPDVTAFTGLDALTQCLEAFVSKRATRFSSMIASEGLGNLVDDLQGAYQAAQSGAMDMQSTYARERLAFASLCGGLALANAGLGAVHGFAAVLGARYPIPHGACCGILLPFVVEANAKQLPDVFKGVQWRLDLKPEAPLSEQLHELNHDLEMPTLAKYGIKAEDVQKMVRLSKTSNSMKGNPVALTDDDLSGILLAAI